MLSPRDEARDRQPDNQFAVKLFRVLASFQFDVSHQFGPKFEPSGNWQVASGSMEINSSRSPAKSRLPKKALEARKSGVMLCQL